jgi:hypothetical protein
MLVSLGGVPSGTLDGMNFAGIGRRENVEKIEVN